jgi:hypothetical protein
MSASSENCHLECQADLRDLSIGVPDDGEVYCESGCEGMCEGDCEDYEEVPDGD